MRKIKDIYNMKKIEEPMYGLEFWFNDLLDKSFEELTVSDVCIMLRQNVCVEMGILKSLEYLENDPLIGDVFNNELIGLLSSVDKELLLNQRNMVIKFLSNLEEKGYSHDSEEEDVKENEEMVKRLKNRLG